jgi:hypothetical protein
VHICVYHASHGRRTCTYVVHALCDVSAFPTSVLFLRAFGTLFTEGARAKPEKKWGALGACHALNALNPRIFFSRCNLKPADIGYFEPKAMPDSEAAMNFIESFTDAVIHYGEANTLEVLRKCCHNDIARAWVSSLKDADRTAIARSTWHWEFVLRRDFMPGPTQLYAAA